MSVHPIDMDETDVEDSQSLCGCGVSDDRWRQEKVSPRPSPRRRLSVVKIQEVFKNLNMGEIYDVYITKMYQGPCIALMCILFVYAVTLLILFNFSREVDTITNSKWPINLVLAISISLAVAGIIIVSIRRSYAKLHKGLTALVWLFMIGTVYIYTILFKRKVHHTSLDDVPMISYTIFVIHTMLPLKKRHALWIGALTGAFAVLFSVLIGVLLDKQPVNARQVVADVVLYICVNVIGGYHKLVTDHAHRCTFLETRNFIESHAYYGEQKRKQNELKTMLLHKVMPEYLVESIQTHIIEEAEVGEAILDVKPTQFHELFIKSTMNVSILYADIVKFTPLTASLTPLELVHALNQLFGKFDQLAQRNDCYRIKILGDCYYCVSGLPDPTDDHAKNCVKMGKLMIGVIRQIRRESGIMSLDMRIGIHTGNVLSGILGHRKLQYDIWSNAVTIANHMESSGKPGKVHVTESTARHLGDEFSLEEGYGEDRDDLIKKENLRTYLITPSPEELGGQVEDKTVEEARLTPVERPRSSGTPRSQGRTGRRKSNSSGSEYRMSRRESMAVVGAVSKFRDNNRIFDSLTEYVLQRDIPSHLGVNQRLGELFDDDSVEMRNMRATASKEINMFTLFFREMSMQLDYIRQRDIDLKLSVLIAFVIFICIFIVQLLVIKRNLQVYVTFACGCLAFALTGITLAVLDYKVNHSADFTPPWISHPATTAGFRYVGIVIMLAATFILSFVAVGDCKKMNITDTKLRSEFNATLWFEYEKQGVCIFQTYILYCVIISMMTCSIFIRLLFPLKLVILLLMTGIFYGVCFGPYLAVFTSFDIFVGLDQHLFHVKIRGPLYTSLLFITLFILSRQIEYDLRLNYLWKTKIAHEDQQIKRAEKINTKLLENILPKHVARYFMNPKRDRNFGVFCGSHQATEFAGVGHKFCQLNSLFDLRGYMQEVYHRHYHDVTVMFAAITDFLYEENEASGMGVGCIRLLNEILISFDKLLEKPEYNAVEKIKSINTTYMAAAGLGEERNQQDDCDGTTETVSVLERKHTRQMVKFALKMMEVLKESNEDSFNESCSLRIGINHGEVIAGVVGAQKPQYDIWGNTVNIASRMESHGRAGRIQVPERTRDILDMEGIACDTPREMSVKGVEKPMIVYYVKEGLDVTEIKTPEHHRRQNGELRHEFVETHL